jgi:hypothetical protein
MEAIVVLTVNAKYHHCCKERSHVMNDSFKKGDRVQWNTSQGKTTGVVKKKLSRPTDIKEHHVAASNANPEYLVRSEKTGAEAAHKARALKKAR